MMRSILDHLAVNKPLGAKNALCFNNEECGWWMKYGRDNSAHTLQPCTAYHRPPSGEFAVI